MEVLPRELLVLPDVGRDHPPDPVGEQQHAQAPLVDAAVVRHRLELVGALLEQRVDEHRRDAAQPEAADRDRRAARDVGDGLGGARDHLVHGRSSLSSRPGRPGPDTLARPLWPPSRAVAASLTHGCPSPRRSRATRARRDRSCASPTGPACACTSSPARAAPARPRSRPPSRWRSRPAGKTVLLCEVEGRQGIAQLFDVPPLPYEERRVVQGPDDGGDVYALAIDPESALLEYLSMYYRLGRRRQGARPVRRHRLRHHHRARRARRAADRQGLRGRRSATAAPRTPGTYDAVVLDAPPTGRIAQFLNVNSELAGLAKVGPDPQPGRHA